MTVNTTIPYFSILNSQFSILNSQFSIYSLLTCSSNGVCVSFARKRILLR